MNLLAVPKSDNAERALNVLSLAIESERSLNASAEMGYAPVRAAGAALIKKRYRQVMPIGKHLDNVLWGNGLWWRTEGKALESRFYQFLNEQYVDDNISALEPPVQVGQSLVLSSYTEK